MWKNFGVKHVFKNIDNMKNFILFWIMVFIFISCDNSIFENKSTSIVEPKHNTQKDIFVISHLNQKPIFIDYLSGGFVNIYTLRYKDCEFIFSHYLDIPYKYKSYWSYSCVMKNGDIVMIQSVYDVWEHKCSDSVYKVIQKYCLNIK